MQPQSFVISVEEIPPVARRKEHALVLLRDRDGTFILARKEIYPPQIYRMVGGGVEKGETFTQAAIRETYEELHLVLQPEKLRELAQVIFHITDKQSDKAIFETHIFYAEVGDQPILPSEELAEIIHVDERAFHALINHYAELPQKIDPLVKFSWFDYGKIYGPMHRIALEAVKDIAQTSVTSHRIF